MAAALAILELLVGEPLRSCLQVVGLAVLAIFTVAIDHPRFLFWQVDCPGLAPDWITSVNIGELAFLPFLGSIRNGFLLCTKSFDEGIGVPIVGAVAHTVKR